MSDHLDLSSMRSRRVNALVESDRRSLQSLQGHRTCDIGETRNSLRAIKRQPADGGHRLRAVQERDAFLGFELHWLNPGLLQSLRARHALALVKGFAFANHRQSEMG